MKNILEEKHLLKLEATDMKSTQGTLNCQQLYLVHDSDVPSMGPETVVNWDKGYASPVNRNMSSQSM